MPATKTSIDRVSRTCLPTGVQLREYGPLRAIVAKADDEEEREFVVVGYASPQVVDREKHLITKAALAKDLPRFLAHPKYRNANIVHSNIQVAEVLPEWTNPESGETYATHVDEVGLFCVVKLRTDRFRPKICERVEEDVLSGKLNSFSISGDAPFESRQYQCADGVCFWIISAIELYEITICEEGVNPDAKFSIVSKALRPRLSKADAVRLSQFCADGSCPLSPDTSMVDASWGDDDQGGAAEPAKPEESMDPDAVDQRTDPRRADTATPGQDWVQKAHARIRRGVVVERCEHGVPY